MDNTEMSRDFFIIAYDGEALCDHSMDIRILTPALLAVSDLVSEANRIINGEDSKIKIGIKAFEAGSFEIHFEIVESLVKNILNYFSGSEWSGLSNILGIGSGGVGGVGGLFWLIKKIRGRKEKDVIPISDKELKIIFSDNETLIIDKKVYDLYQEPKIRQACKKIVADPLKKEGINSLQIRNKKAKSKEDDFRVDKKEAIYFEVQGKEEILTEQEYEQYLTIISPVFDPGKKWSLSDGDATLLAFVKDEDFLQKIENREISFTKGDRLHCLVHAKQKNTKNRLKKEYEISKIIEYIPAIMQPSLFEEGEEEEAPDL